jgi:quinol monooxygenase YgiN
MELFLIARFHAREGQEDAVDQALKAQVALTRPEPGCLMINAYRSTRDPRQFFIHSRWADERAFDVHAELPNTLQFIARMETLIDHPFDAQRLRVIG